MESLRGTWDLQKIPTRAALKLNNLFIFNFCLCWVFIAVHGLSLVVSNGGDYIHLLKLNLHQVIYSLPLIIFIPVHVVTILHAKNLPQAILQFMP